MRIGYFVPPTLLAHEGISRRVAATMRAWERLGHTPITVGTPAESGGNPLLRHLQGDAEAAGRLRRGDLVVDHVHVRLFLPTPAWMRLPGTLPLSVEVQAGLRRPENARDTVRVALGAATARALVARSSMGAFITQEFAAYPEYRRVPRKIVLGNGVELTPAHPAPGNSRPVVGMAIGTPAQWHGLDRFVALAGDNPQLDFVAIVPARLSGAFASDLQGTPVSLLPTTDAQAYEEALAGLDVAVGSLALERKGLREAAPLKVRDYVRAGIPTALAYTDTNLSGLGDEAILQWDGTAGPTFTSWAERQVGARVSEAARQAISIDGIEARRVAAMVR